MKSITTDQLTAWLRDAAESLAVRLQRGHVPRARRRETRSLLLRAFNALEEDAVTMDLFEAVDQASVTPVVIPRPIKIGWHLKLAVVDRDLVGRVFGYEQAHERIYGRAERFLAATGRGSLTLSVKAPVEGSGAVLDFDLTEG